MRTPPNLVQSLDDRDRRLLALVQRDAKLPQAELAKRVGLSAAAVNERLKKLEHSGAIRHYAARVDPVRVGAPLAAFVEVFIERVLALDEVQECHHITGEFSLLLKVRVRDIASLQDLLLNQLNAFEGVRQTRTVMVLSTLKEDSYVPTGAKGDES